MKASNYSNILYVTGNLQILKFLYPDPLQIWQTYTDNKSIFPTLIFLNILLIRDELFTQQDIMVVSNFL